MHKRIAVILTMLLLSFGGYVLPVLAHGEATLTVSPTVAAVGDTITVSLEEVESGKTFTIMLVSLNIEETLGTMIVEEGEEAVNQEFTLPADVSSDVYQIEATSGEGETLSAELTIEAGFIDNTSNEVVEPSDELMQLDRGKSPVELITIGGGIVISAGLGLWLVFANGRK